MSSSTLHLPLSLMSLTDTGVGQGEKPVLVTHRETRFYFAQGKMAHLNGAIKLFEEKDVVRICAPMVRYSK